MDSPTPLGEPIASRSRMLQYRIPQDLDGVLPWSWAVERLVLSHNYWVSTVDLGGGPHLVPVWGVWLPEGFYFDTAATSRKARNLAKAPRNVVTTEGAYEAVIVHGRADARTPGAFSADADAADADAAYASKYGEAPPGQRFLVRPEHASEFIEQASEFGRTATRRDFT